jgi:hypothetical protein
MALRKICRDSKLRKKRWRAWIPYAAAEDVDDNTAAEESNKSFFPRSVVRDLQKRLTQPSNLQQGYGSMGFQINFYLRFSRKAFLAPASHHLPAYFCHDMKTR